MSKYNGDAAHRKSVMLVIVNLYLEALKNAKGIDDTEEAQRKLDVCMLKLYGGEQ